MHANYKFITSVNNNQRRYNTRISCYLYQLSSQLSSHSLQLSNHYQTITTLIYRIYVTRHGKPNRLSVVVSPPLDGSTKLVLSFGKPCAPRLSETSDWQLEKPTTTFGSPYILAHQRLNLCCIVQHDRILLCI